MHVLNMNEYLMIIVCIYIHRHTHTYMYMYVLNINEYLMIIVCQVFINLYIIIMTVNISYDVP